MRSFCVLVLCFLAANATHVGVRFGGYHASAGLGGGVGGGLLGGLHAEAGTPYGQEAGAGLGGVVLEKGGAIGGGFAGTKTATFTAGSIADNVVAAAPAHAEAPTAHKTIIERTVIPNYVEKTVQVPSYVEKTIRVPTFVEQRVRVPAAPTVLEKTVSEVDVPVPEHKPVQSGYVVHKSVAAAPVETYSNGHAGGFGGLFARGGFGGGGATTATGSFDGKAASGLFDSIFNIPISTLRAVNQLVNGFAGGASGSASFSKSVHAY